MKEVEAPAPVSPNLPSPFQAFTETSIVGSR